MPQHHQCADEADNDWNLFVEFHGEDMVLYLLLPVKNYFSDFIFFFFSILFQKSLDFFIFRVYNALVNLIQ